MMSADLFSDLGLADGIAAAAEAAGFDTPTAIQEAAFATRSRPCARSSTNAGRAIELTAREAISSAQG